MYREYQCRLIFPFCSSFMFSFLQDITLLDSRPNNFTCLVSWLAVSKIKEHKKYVLRIPDRFLAKKRRWKNKKGQVFFSSEIHHEPITQYSTTPRPLSVAFQQYCIFWAFFPESIIMSMNTFMLLHSISMIYLWLFPLDINISKVCPIHLTCGYLISSSSLMSFSPEKVIHTQTL